MLQILQGCFPRSEELRIFSMLRLQYVLLVFLSGQFGMFAQYFIF